MRATYYQGFRRGGGQGRHHQDGSLTQGLHSRPIGSFNRRTLRYEAGAQNAGSENSEEFDLKGAEDVKVKYLQYVGSYNMTNDDNPTIIVPGERHSMTQRNRLTMNEGSPPEWREPLLPLTVSNDSMLSGTISVSQDHPSRFPSARLLPLFASVDAIAKSSAVNPLEWSAVDFVSDRNALRKLLRWAAKSKKWGCPTPAKATSSCHTSQTGAKGFFCLV
jgi:hypothetical protein